MKLYTFTSQVKTIGTPLNFLGRKLNFPYQSLKTVLFFSLLLFSLTASQNLMAQPSNPAGLVANSAAGAGEVFLACGPNQTSDADIIYRLYYSPTASAPADPLTATEYTFGSTPGDGGGNAAFGFTMTGLTPGTGYTFWLYQYDIVTMLFSTSPSSASQTSGAAGGPPQTPAGFVANPASGTGEVFLACGPNQVADADIIYRLYFSPTASAPADPLTATEYTFGSTPGDGGGDAAFGFNMAGLTPNVDYTFWLYQYDTNLMLFSTSPASSTEVALPVTWLNPLRAILLDDKSVRITWSVSTQMNNEKFIIEYSNNGIDFSPIGEIEGSGTTTITEEYMYTHENPTQGSNYYRITQIDYDGKYSNSNIAEVWYDDQEILIYPNPTAAELNIRTIRMTTLNIRDYYGRFLKSQMLTEGENIILVDELPSGLYILEFDNGHIQNFIKR